MKPAKSFDFQRKAKTWFHEAIRSVPDSSIRQLQGFRLSRLVVACLVAVCGKTHNRDWYEVLGLVNMANWYIRLLPLFEIIFWWRFERRSYSSHQGNKTPRLREVMPDQSTLWLFDFFVLSLILLHRRIEVQPFHLVKTSGPDCCFLIWGCMGYLAFLYGTSGLSKVVPRSLLTECDKPFCCSIHQRLGLILSRNACSA